MTYLKQFAPRIPVRLVIGIMIFLGAAFGYMLTFNFSICLLAMVQPPPDENGQTIELPDFGPRYSWSAYEESLVVGAYFYGNVLSSFPSGLLIERFGYAKLSLGLSLLLIIGLTWLSPLAAGVSFSAMFTVRLLIGLLTGGRVPAFTLLISKWAPSNELGLFTFTNMGTNIGTVLSWSLAGLIIETLGWAVAFYVSGCIALVFVCCWMWLVYDSPAVHPRITADERAHIEANIHGVSECRGWPPLGRMLGSLPFWALMIAQFSNAWGTFFVLTAVPKFFNEILRLPIGSTGVLASFPYIMRTVFAFVFGCVAKWLEARYPLVSLTVWRKTYCVFSHIIPGLLLVAMPFHADEPYVCVALLTLSYGINGAVSVVTIANYHDLAPNYATTINSIVNGTGNIAGFLSPLVVAYFTQEHNTVAEWHSIFYVGAAIYIGSAVVFVLGGSGGVQPWNDVTATVAVDEKLEHGGLKVDGLPASK